MQLIPKGRVALYSRDLWPQAVWKSRIINRSEFLVVLVETADLLRNFDVKYAEAHQVMHLNTKTASRKYSCCLTGNQHYMPGIEYIFAKYRSYTSGPKTSSNFCLKMPLLQPSESKICHDNIYFSLNSEKETCLKMQFFAVSC